jgi:hypothetical protein
MALNVILLIVPLLFTESQGAGYPFGIAHLLKTANTIPLYTSPASQVNRRRSDVTGRSCLLAAKTAMASYRSMKMQKTGRWPHDGKPSPAPWRRAKVHQEKS